ncbi:hypothetical protein TARUN_8578 [Trichoderma arundinaceum]|uniref:Uncharacterized protein n=1 Tax=Trichoderma arundinaceum TaxID=490622 RepID=A0A395NC39_TRIAR|nr:hypothetical protein TARUN_8578 [Trichoderma arundinaceum]
MAPSSTASLSAIAASRMGVASALPLQLIASGFGLLDFQDSSAARGRRRGPDLRRRRPCFKTELSQSRRELKRERPSRSSPPSTRLSPSPEMFLFRSVQSGDWKGGFEWQHVIT